jgi:hypothetical protein
MFFPVRNSSLEPGKKPTKLSFAIQKAPERKTKQTVAVEKKPRKGPKRDQEEKRTATIPDKFLKLAKKFGLPEEHIAFFYENRESFHWESINKTDLHCHHLHCKFTVKSSFGCLVDHMKTVHDYTDMPCSKTDCSYIAYSNVNLNYHVARFHGHGRKPAERACHSCPYASCKVSFLTPAELLRHTNVHQNIVMSCRYCQYRTAAISSLQSHLKIHFDIRDWACDVCPLKFSTKQKLNIHKQGKHNTDDFICVDCGFITQKMGYFAKHRKTCKERLKHSRIL